MRSSSPRMCFSAALWAVMTAGYLPRDGSKTTVALSSGDLTTVPLARLKRLAVWFPL